MGTLQRQLYLLILNKDRRVKDLLEKSVAKVINPSSFLIKRHEKIYPTLISDVAIYEIYSDSYKSDLKILGTLKEYLSTGGQMV